MATAAAIAIKVAEFQDNKNKLRSLLSYIRSSINQLPEGEQQKARQLTITLNSEIQNIIEFGNEDLIKNNDESLKQVAAKIEKMRKETKSPAIKKQEIQSNYLQRKWFPTTAEEFFMYPYDIHRGIVQPEGLFQNSCRFHPRSLFSQTWCSLHAFFIVIYAILLPIGIAFDGAQGLVLPITLLLMIITAFDTYLIFDTGIIVEQELAMDKKEVFHFHWSKHTMFYNVIVGLPYVIIVDALTPFGSVERKAGRLICMINALVVPKMFTSTRVSFISEKITQWIQIYEVNQSLTKSVYIITGMAFYWHWFSCSVQFLQWFSVLPNPYPLLEDRDHYSVFFFESASIMFSAAWGAIPPVATHDRLSKIVNMVMSAFILALFTANITTFMIRLDSSGRLFAEKLDEVSQYIQYKGLGRDIQERIFQYYHFKYSKGKYFDEAKILGELNDPLRVAISMRECRPLIVQVPFFKDADHSFITQVVTILKVNHFLHDDVIIEQGTTGDQMFFIESGNVEVIVDGKSVAVLQPEINLLFGHMKRTGTIKAITTCVLYSLSQGDLQGILEINPDMASKMREVAEERLRLNQASLSIQKAGPNVNIVQFVDNSYGGARQSVHRKSVTEHHSTTQKTIDRAIEAVRRASFIVPMMNQDIIANSIVLGNEDHHDGHSAAITHDTSGHKLQKGTKNASQFSLNPNVHGDIINEIEAQELLDMVQTNQRKASVANFTAGSFLDSHIANHPNQTKNETVIIDNNGQKEQIEIHRKRKSKLILDTAIPAPIEESLNSAIPENQPVDRFAVAPVEEAQDEVFLVPGQAIHKSFSSISAGDKQSKNRSQLSINAESKRKTSNLEDDLAKSTASLSKAVPRSVKQSRELLQSDEAEVKINMDLKEEAEDEDLDDAPKKTPTRKQMNKEPTETKMMDKNFDDVGKNLSFGTKMVKLWNKYQPSTKYAPLHPNMLVSQIWNSVFQVSFFIVAILLPLPFGFQSLRDMLPGLSIFVVIICVLDFLLKLQTGYAQFEEVEMEPAKLIKIYATNGTFLFDFITGFPWVFVIDAITVNDTASQDAARLFCLVHGLPFFKSLLGSRRSYLSEYLTEYIRKHDVNVSAVQAIKILFAIFFYMHWHSCSANFIMRMSFVPNPYPDLMNFNAYTLHFWTSATEMFNAGCGAAPPVVTLDRWLKVANMIFNCTLVALFVGNISSFMIGLDSSGRQFNEQLEQVSQYINYKGLGRELKKKILDYYQLKYSKGKYFDEQKILSELNHPLRLAIYMRECRALIIQVPFFKGADNGFISQVVMILKPAHFLPDDLVIEKGTAADYMFFIATGNLEVLLEDRPVAELSPGQFFGEIALLFGHMKRTASIRAKTACTLYSLSRSDLDSILEVYPDMAEKLQKTAEERLSLDLQINMARVGKVEDQDD